MGKSIGTKRGFTLVELLVVIAIIGVLVTIVVIAINPTKVIRQSQDTKARSELTQVKAAMQLYYNENRDYPAACPSLVPTYIKQLPRNLATCAGAGQTYEATATIYYVVGADIESSQGCGHGAQAAGVAGTFYICPD